MLRTARATLSMIAQKAYGPAPNPIGGNGGIHTKTPELVDPPKKGVVIVTRIIPTNMKRKPRKKSLRGIDHENTPITGALGLRRL